MKYYAGIGSRQTPDDVLTQMLHIAGDLKKEGYILRSGGAKGADSFFQAGSGDDNEIFVANDCTEAAVTMAAEYHPNWGACNSFVRKLHGRNCMIILGQDLDTPVDFIVCWTPDGLVTGGTGQALRMAKKLGIKVFNLAVDKFQYPLL